MIKEMLSLLLLNLGKYGSLLELCQRQRSIAFFLGTWGSACVLDLARASGRRTGDTYIGVGTYTALCCPWHQAVRHR